MAIDYLVSAETSDVEDERSESQNLPTSSPPFVFPSHQLPHDPNRQPNPSVQRPSHPEPTYFTNSTPMAPPFLEPSTQPSWVQDSLSQTPQRMRMPSVSSAASSSSDGPSTGRHRPRRAARPKYTPEMAYAIWWFKADMRQSWPEVRASFNSLFPEFRDVSGIQSKYYRVLEDHGVPKIREQRRGRGTPPDSNHDVKLRDRCPEVYYPWMDSPLPK
jgi:hypothetical protein